MSISATVPMTGADGHLQVALLVLAEGFMVGGGMAAIGLPGIMGFHLFALVASLVCLP